MRFESFVANKEFSPPGKKRLRFGKAVRSSIYCLAFPVESPRPKHTFSPEKSFPPKVGFSPKDASPKRAP